MVGGTKKASNLGDQLAHREVLFVLQVNFYKCLWVTNTLESKPSTLLAIVLNLAASHTFANYSASTGI